MRALLPSILLLLAACNASEDEGASPEAGPPGSTAPSAAQTNAANMADIEAKASADVEAALSAASGPAPATD
ncbi:MAG: hypothetical protein ACMVO5_04830 [Polymorphobacter sp.]|uniref:hypothetical protein n=1 Tax=Polymorphobacter sp. TaxID=1909290 RepID=UPI003A8B5984